MKAGEVYVLECPHLRCGFVVVGNTLDLLRHVRDEHPTLTINWDGHMEKATTKLVELAAKERFMTDYDHPPPENHQ